MTLNELAALKSGTTLTPMQHIWHRWLLDVLPTYQNNPHENEAANTAVRQAALKAREEVLVNTGEWTALKARIALANKGRAA